MTEQQLTKRLREVGFDVRVVRGRLTIYGGPRERGRFFLTAQKVGWPGKMPKILDKWEHYGDAIEDASRFLLSKYQNAS